MTSAAWIESVLLSRLMLSFVGSFFTGMAESFSFPKQLGKVKCLAETALLVV